MAAPHAPIIVLRQGDDAVCAFFTKDEAVQHFDDPEHPHEPDSADLARWDFFDARGRQLTPVIASDGQLEDLTVAGTESRAEQIRQRVRRRSQHARKKLEEKRKSFERVDESPLTLADDDVVLELFAWRLASAMRPGGSPSDPVPKVGHFGPRHSAGWWHNTFGH